jgi:hypothetical protein
VKRCAWASPAACRRCPQGLIFDQALNGCGQRSFVASGNQQGCIASRLGQGGVVGAHHRGAAGHGLDHRDAKALVARGKGEDVGRRVEGGQVGVVHEAGEDDVVTQRAGLGGCEDAFHQPTLAPGDHQAMR